MNSVDPQQQQWEDGLLLVASTEEVLLPSVTVPLSGPLAKRLSLYDDRAGHQTFRESASEIFYIGWVAMPPSRNTVAIQKGDIGALCRASVSGGAPVTLQVLTRFRVVSVQEKDLDFKEFFRGSVEVIPRQSLKDVPDSDSLLASYLRSVNALSQALSDMRLSPTLLKRINNILSNAPPENLIDILSSVLGLSFEEKFEMLVTLDVKSRLEKSIEYLDRILVKSKQLQLRDLANDQRNKLQRQALLKRQLVSIKKELEALEKECDADKDGNEETESDAKSLLKRIIEAKLPKEIHTAAMRDVKRLKQMPPSMAEFQVLQSYLEVLLDLPWTQSSQESYDVPRARKVLDEDHQGLERVKDRILEYVAVCQLTQGSRGPILCFIGPPGVGKTSLGKSIARALERPFHRISLGGVHDEAQIRGHRRTYVGALPGLLIQAYRKSHVNNPVFLLGLFFNPIVSY